MPFKLSSSSTSSLTFIKPSDNNTVSNNTAHLRLHNLPSAQGKRCEIPILRPQIPHFVYLCRLLWTAGIQGRLESACEVDGYNTVHSMTPAVGSRRLRHENWRMWACPAWNPTSDACCGQQTFEVDPRQHAKSMVITCPQHGTFHYFIWKVPTWFFANTFRGLQLKGQCMSLCHATWEVGIYSLITQLSEIQMPLDWTNTTNKPKLEEKVEPEWKGVWAGSHWAICWLQKFQQVEL